ncbi:AAA family ATPase [Niallia taxi]|uniref:AAA family ATPase n=1 Tax=Niallia taxi TaxID=2499688 RepID=UPI00254FC2C1|nr:AAA family ATPase [Niallia taxi]MDK8641690.1 AAA family ATPase [Niallia taxi]
MYLQEVSIKNFRGFGENQERTDRCFIFDKLDSDFVIFYGFNGFGKSSFFEAIEWCLTDTVKRLENYNVNYHASELKKSHHLKFFHPILGNITEREIYVKLKFSNGLQIVRKSSSIAHKFGNEDNYNSELEIMKNGRVLKNEELFNEFGMNFENLYQFLNTHFLGQENLSSFLRSNSPESRKSIFMKLLSLNKLDSTYREIADLKSSGKFKRKKDQLISVLSTNTSLLTKINKYIEDHNFKNVNEYLVNINNELTDFKLLFSNENVENLISEEFKKYIFSLNEIKLDECFNFIKEIKKEKKSIGKFSDKQYQNQLDLKSQLEIIKILEHLEKGMKLLKKEENYLFIKDHDYEKTSDSLKKVYIEKLRNKSSVDKFVDEQNKLSKILAQKIRLDEHINEITNEITKEFWDGVLEFRKTVLNLEREFSPILKELGVSNSVIKNFSIELWDEYKEEYLILKQKLKSIVEKTFEKEQNIKKLSNLNTQYTEALNTVKNYIFSNQVEQCPVCLNSDFTDLKYQEINPNFIHESINQKLLLIMDFTIGKGNTLIETEIDENERLLLEKKIVNEKIKELIHRITNTFNGFIKQYTEITTKISNYLNDSINVTMEHIVLNESKEKQLENRIQILESLYKELFNTEYDIKNKVELKDIDNLLLTVKTEINDWIDTIDVNYIKFNSRPDYLSVYQKNQELKSRLGNEITEPYKQKLILVDRIKKGSDKLSHFEQIINRFDLILLYSLPDEFDEKFKDYYEIAKENLVIEQEIKQVDDYKTEAEKFYIQLQTLRDKAVESKLKKHPIIGWIYESINPHPFYQELSITNDGRGANFKDKSGTLYLDHIFSNAQLNILALSVFLGLGLSVEDELNQLFLDDPIQSMDDVNILALIDVFRGIMDSKFKNKKLLISTHDSNFAKLLSIKMRNRKIVQYHFKSYTEEGPIVFQL